MRSVLAFLPLPAPLTARNKNLPGFETPRQVLPTTGHVRPGGPAGIVPKMALQKQPGHLPQQA